MLEIKGLSQEVVAQVLARVESEYFTTHCQNNSFDSFTNWLVISRVLQAVREGEKISFSKPLDKVIK
jgi:hypothetical protein